MRCTNCGSNDCRVVDSRPLEDGYAIRRRRECSECKERFTTYEKIEQVTLIVVKKNETRDFFDREKISRGIFKACEKTSVASEKVDELVSSIEKELIDSGNKEITSVAIGEMVMSGLQKIDEVAYVRFASVYREFKDVETFMQEIQELLKK